MLTAFCLGDGLAIDLEQRYEDRFTRRGTPLPSG